MKQPTNKKKDTSIQVYQKDKIDFELKIKERSDLTDKQKIIIEKGLDKNTKCIFIDAVYGTSKTFLCCYLGLKLLDQKRVDEIIYIRNPVEASTTGKIGFLKGEVSDKMAPYNAPFYEKLEEMIPENNIIRLKKENRLTCLPVGFVRGHSWNCKAVIVDEASSMSYDDLFLILTRCGEFTKIFFVGDSKNQNDIGAKSGFVKMFTMFNDQESRDNGVFCYTLDQIDDIVRSKFLRFVMVKAGLIKLPEKPETITNNK